MTEDEMNVAAHRLRSEVAEGHAGHGDEGEQRPPYYEHLGGYSLGELKDYNQYSHDDLLQPVEQECADEMVYVTTL